MKNIFAFFLLMLLSISSAMAQPYYKPTFHNGEISKNFSSSLFSSGQLFNLYDELAEGKTIYIFVFVITNQTSFDFHNSGVLQDFYAAHGPEGDNTAIVLGFLGGNVSLALLNGTAPVGQTAGNWLTNMTYPLSTTMFSSMPQKFYQENCVVRVCPDKQMYRMDSLPDLATLEATIGLCEVGTEAIDAKIVYSNTDTLGACSGELRHINAYLCNMGSDTLTSCDIVVATHGQAQKKVAWSGHLAPYALDTVALTNLLLTGNEVDIQFYTNNPNGLPDQKPANDTLTRHLTAAPSWVGVDSIEIDILLDNSGPEFYWDLKNSAGITIDSGGYSPAPFLVFYGLPFPNLNLPPYGSFAHIQKKIAAVSGECYVFRAFTATGLGVCCAYGVGYIKIKRNGEVVYDYPDMGYYIIAPISVTPAMEIMSVSYGVTPTTNGQSNGSIAVTATGGVSPYEYSNNCGETFVTNPLFSNLAAGWYCMTTRDAMGMLHTDSVQVGSVETLNASYAVVNTTNTQANGSITVTASGGLPPYQYSKDCGANFGSSNEFSNLAAGSYCIVTKDAVGQTVTDTVEVQNVNDALFASYAVTHTTNGLANGSITVTASGGVAPYQYSNDCGANFGSSNVFGSLAAGTYCMITKDAIGQTVTDSVVVNSSISATDAPRGLSGLSVRPNPAKDNINIGFALTQSSTIGISVYNAIGQQVVSMPTRVYATGQQSVQIDVAVLPTGLYFVVLQDEHGANTVRFMKR